MLTKTQIRQLLEELRYETVYTDDTTIRLQKRVVPGYSADPLKAQLQAKLSVMLETAREE